MASRIPSSTQLDQLSPFPAEGPDVYAIIDTPQGSRNKFKYDAELGLFKLSGVLPAGAIFPFDFGFVPSTKGDDGDALDVLVLLDEPAFVGCLIETRLIGVIEAEQTEQGETTRNDRMIGVATKARNHKGVRSLSQLHENLIAEIEHFFVSYNEIKGKVFTPLGRGGPQRARNLVEAGVREFKGSKARRGGTKSVSSKGKR